MRGERDLPDRDLYDLAARLGGFAQGSGRHACPQRVQSLPNIEDAQVRAGCVDRLIREVLLRGESVADRWDARDFVRER